MWKTDERPSGRHCGISFSVPFFHHGGQHYDTLGHFAGHNLNFCVLFFVERGFLCVTALTFLELKLCATITCLPLHL